MVGGGALPLAFFLSGAAGLIFQVVWFYRAGLVFGNSVWAVTVVLSSFMGGLALGSARLQEVGFEAPEQIGATFLGDAAYLQALTAQTPPLTDNCPQRLRPIASRVSLSDPRFDSDGAVAEHYQRVVDPSRARQAFVESAWIRQHWPKTLIEQTVPWFEQQVTINRVFWEGGRPLQQIEDLHALVSGTRLATLPLWILGTDEVKQAIAETAGEEDNAIAYARGLSALAARNFTDAAALFSEAEAGGLKGPALRPLLVYALCADQRLDEARALARGIRPGNSEEVHFWSWIGQQFNVGPFSHKSQVTSHKSQVASRKSQVASHKSQSR